MKKRILCVMLTLIMLVSLIPAGAISASAASLKISEPAITVLKKMTEYVFQGECYQYGHTDQYRIGYGTVCNGKDHGKKDSEGDLITHTITEYEADKALRKYLAKVDEKVNNFASNNGMSMKQNQHDALVIFSYGVGTAWMSGNGVLKTALVNNAGINELLSAMAAVDNDMTRRKIEANMYVNGIYSNVIPETFSVVKYNAQGGSMPQSTGTEGGNQIFEMHFDKTQTVPHTPVPLKKGYNFLGWYNAPTNGQRVPNLTASCAGKTLYAVWQDKAYQDTTEKLWEKTVKVDYTYKISELPSLHAYFAPNGKEDETHTKWLKDQKSYTEVKIYTEYMDIAGNRWGNIAGVGWVLMPGSSVSGGSSDDNGYTAEIDVTVTVTNSYVRSRKNASIHSPQNGIYHQGDKLRIINTANGSGYLWGQIAESAESNKPIGWVALMYTNWNSVNDGDKGSSENTTPIARATIMFGGYVNMRSAAGTDHKIVGALAQNETVNVYEIKTVNGHQWGRTNGGWFCLTYADLTMLNGNKIENISDEGALSYVFEGYLPEWYVATAGDRAPRQSPSNQADDVERYHEFKDSDEKTHTVNLWPVAEEKITILNMVKRGSGETTETWVKISWRVDLDDNGSDDTTKYGWLKIDSRCFIGSDVNLTDVDLSLSSAPVLMYPVRFTVAADEVTVRKTPNSGAEALPIKLNKGVEVQINAIKLVGENIWGYLDNEHVYGEETKEGVKNSMNEVFNGWVNLASKYFSRTSLPTVGGDDSATPTGKIGTIVGTDKVNVRITGSTSGKIIGKLSRGTSANILATSANGNWYNLDIDVDNNPKTGTWVNKQYVEVSDGTIGGGSSSDGKPAPVVTGIGIVANTYAGVNVRSGAGQSYPSLGKLLPGTTVKVSEIKQAGAAKWAHVEQGWICMDYVTMLSEETTYPDGYEDPDKGTNVGSYEELEKTTTTAVYTGEIAVATHIYSETVHWEEALAKNARAVSTNASEKYVREASVGEPVTIYEIIKVKEVDADASSSGNDGHGGEVEIVRTSYWARTNDGYIFNPQAYIDLDALDEKVHTLPGEKLNIRDGNSEGGANPDGKILGKLKQGAQVKVTALDIVYDKVWGRIDHEGVTGWIRLDMMSEGAYYVEEKPSEPTTPPSNGPILGAGSDNGGFVNNSGGYRYTGKVINTNKVNVRATPSDTATITTTLKAGQALVIYETQTAGNMAWGRCDAGWVYLYYVDLTPVTGNGAIDSRVVANNKAAVIYTDSNCSDTVGNYAGMSVIDIYEIVGKMARTDLGWVSTDDLL